MLDKIKLYLSIFGGLVISILTLEFLRRGNKIDSLESALTGERAGRIGDEIKGELNAKENDVLKAKEALENADAKFHSSRQHFDKSREDLRRSIEELHRDSGGSKSDDN